jgi:hypothetical protein
MNGTRKNFFCKKGIKKERKKEQKKEEKPRKPEIFCVTFDSYFFKPGLKPNIVFVARFDVSSLTYVTLMYHGCLFTSRHGRTSHKV